MGVQVIFKNGLTIEKCLSLPRPCLEPRRVVHTIVLEKGVALPYLFASYFVYIELLPNKNNYETDSSCRNKLFDGTDTFLASLCEVSTYSISSSSMYNK